MRAASDGIDHLHATPPSSADRNFPRGTTVLLPPARGEALAAMVSSHPTGNALGGGRHEQNWGKFDADNWGGFNARSQAARRCRLRRRGRGKERRGQGWSVAVVDALRDDSAQARPRAKRDRFLHQTESHGAAAGRPVIGEIGQQPAIEPQSPAILGPARNCYPVSEILRARDFPAASRFPSWTDTPISTFGLRPSHLVLKSR
jgi:hypothetical protein